MAYSQAVNPPYTSNGAGSAVLPEYWVPELGKALATYALWSRFASDVILDVPLLRKGNGQYIHYSHTTDLSISTTALTAQTAITCGTNQLINGVGTVKEYGNAMSLEGFPIWLSDPGYQAMAMGAQGKQGRDAIRSLTNWGVKVWDNVVGEAAETTELSFVASGTASYDFGTSSGLGSQGSCNMTVGHLYDLRGELGRMGIQPRAELGDRYAYIAPPGGLKWLANASNVQRDAASLGLGDAFTRGFVGAFGGFAFFEEYGQNAVTTWAADTGTALDDIGTAIVLGADAIAAATNMGEESNYLLWYPDIGNDSGRQKQMNIYFLGMAALMLPVTGTNAASYSRAVKVNYVMRDI